MTTGKLPIDRSGGELEFSLRNPQISVTLLTLFTLRYLEFMTLPETSVRQIGLFLINTKFAFCLLCEVIYHLPSTFSIHTL